MVDRLPSGMNYLFTVILAREGDGLVATVAEPGSGLPPRIEQSCVFLESLLARFSPLQRDGLLREPGRHLLFQAADESTDAPSMAFQAYGQSAGIALVPDLYYLFARGYEAEFAEVPAWRHRKRSAIWRGSTTGYLGLTPDNIAELPRYRLCRIARDLGDAIDAKLIGIVQAASPEDHEGVTAHCVSEGLIGGFVQQAEMATYRQLIDIDGNANAWNAIARFRTGCCILRVESPWRQWFHDRISPWEHYVPVRGDLADLGERLDWCRDNDAEAAAIAARGRAFALGMRYEEEMAQAAASLAGLGRAGSD